MFPDKTPALINSPEVKSNWCRVFLYQCPYILGKLGYVFTVVPVPMAACEEMLQLPVIDKLQEV